MYNGQGIYKFATGNIYNGELKHNRQNGHGTFTWADGSEFTGQFKKGIIKG